MLLQVCLSWLLGTLITSTDIACDNSRHLLSADSSSIEITLAECNQLSITEDTRGFWIFRLPGSENFRCFAIPNSQLQTSIVSIPQLRPEAPFCLISQVGGESYDLLINKYGNVTLMNVFGQPIEESEKFKVTTTASSFNTLPFPCLINSVIITKDPITNFVQSFKISMSSITTGNNVRKPGYLTITVAPISVSMLPMAFFLQSYFPMQAMSNPMPLAVSTKVGISADPQTNRNGLVYFGQYNVLFYPNNKSLVLMNLATDDNAYMFDNQVQSGTVDLIYIGTYCETRNLMRHTNRDIYDYMRFDVFSINANGSSSIPIFAESVWEDGFMYISVYVSSKWRMDFLLQNRSSPSYLLTADPWEYFGTLGFRMLQLWKSQNVATGNNNEIDETLIFDISLTNSIPRPGVLVYPYFTSLKFGVSGVICSIGNLNTDVWANVEILDEMVSETNKKRHEHKLVSTMKMSDTMSHNMDWQLAHRVLSTMVWNDIWISRVSFSEIIAQLGALGIKLKIECMIPNEITDGQTVQLLTDSIDGVGTIITQTGLDMQVKMDAIATNSQANLVSVFDGLENVLQTEL